jgi:hypothetical protein
MAEIFHLSAVRDQNAANTGYACWRRRFGETFSIDTRLKDLSHTVLAQLAEPGDESAQLLNSLIIGFLGFPQGTVFDDLPGPAQSRVVDIYLFLADCVRFEMMSRLGWLSSYVGGQYSLFKLVGDFERIRRSCQQHPPMLSSEHPRYAEYKDLFERDQQVFIRKMLQSALEAYKSAFF